MYRAACEPQVRNLKSKPLSDLMYLAACEPQVRKYNKVMDKMKEINEDAYNWLSLLRAEQWTLSFDGGVRYGIMTTNLSESLNGVLKRARRLPITACVRVTFCQTVQWFNRCRSEAQNHISNNNPWPDKVLEMYLKNEVIAGRHRVAAYDRHRGLYEVTTGMHGAQGGNVHVVNLQEQGCTCEKFEAYRIPCSHVIQVCKNMGRISIDMVSEYYTCHKMLMTYNGQLNLIPHEDYWPPTSFPLYADPSRMNSVVGRPRSTRIHNEMDRRRTKKCGVCAEYGHNRSNCPNIERIRQRSRDNN